MQALIHRGNIFIKQGNLKQAESDFKAVVSCLLMLFQCVMCLVLK